MAALGLEFLRFLDGRKAAIRERETEERHHAVLERIARAAVVATDRYDEKKVFSEYFPLDTSGKDLDYSGVEWGSNVTFEVPSEDEMEILRRMMEDNSVTVSAGEVFEAEPGMDLLPGLPEDSGSAQIETDREWV